MTGSFALPVGDSNGELKGSAYKSYGRWKWHMVRESSETTMRANPTCDVQASPYLISLGLKKSHMALVFVAGPLSGLIMQPLIGVLADHSTSSLGRRRPYMLAASMVSIGGLLMLGFTREFSGIFGVKSLTIAIAVYAIFCIDFSINAVQAVDRALLVDILPPTLQAAGNWTQLEVLTVVSSMLLLGFHGITAGSVEEKVLVQDGDSSDSNVLVRIFKDIWDNILTLPRTIRAICMVQFFSWIAWFPVLFYSSTWVGDIYKAAQIANGRADNDPILQDEATRAGSLALLYSSILSFAVSIAAPFFIRPNGKGLDEGHGGPLERFKISLAGLWSASQAVFACAMMATL
ncbi:MFS/sugar transport protein [Ceratobasidium sp. AG-Ba]|nr:MFS/sugar transport protein [Ceratobasidium sp. AG-Ba]